ncbi:MAG: hypothetical protein QXM43_01775 [Desulfurococcaceae archaeon]
MMSKEVDKVDFQHLIIHIIVMAAVFFPPGALIFMRPTVVGGLPLAMWIYWIFAYIYLVTHYGIWAYRRIKALEAESHESIKSGE